MKERKEVESKKQKYEIGLLILSQQWQEINELDMKPQEPEIRKRLQQKWLSS